MEVKRDNVEKSSKIVAERKKMPKVLNKNTDNIPIDAVYVGRPSKWGNPFVVGSPIPGDGLGGMERLDRQTCIELYRATYLWHQPKLVAALHELRGKDLVCWCAPLPCHADILLELANK